MAPDTSPWLQGSNTFSLFLLVWYWDQVRTTSERVLCTSFWEILDWGTSSAVPVALQQPFSKERLCRHHLCSQCSNGHVPCQGLHTMTSQVSSTVGGQLREAGARGTLVGQRWGQPSRAGRLLWGLFGAGLRSHAVAVLQHISLPAGSPLIAHAMVFFQNQPNFPSFKG